MDINCIIQSTENLHLNSSEQNSKNLCVSDDDVKNTANYLLGDEFEKSWDTNKLSLPPKASPLFCYKVCSEQSLFVGDHAFGFPSLSRSDVMPVQFTHLKCLTKGNSKTVYQATLKLKSEKTLDYRPGDSISILPENNAQTVAWLLQRLTLDSLHDADTLFTHEVIATKHRSLPEWSHFTCPLSLRYLLTYCCELYIPVTRRILRLLADYCFDDNVSPVSAERQRNRLLEFSSAEGKKMFEKYIQIPDLNLLDILSIFSCCRPSFIRLLEILPTLQPRSYTLINPVNKQLSCEQELSFIFTRVDFKYPESDKHVGLIDRYPSRRHGTCTGWLEKIWFGVNQPDDYQKVNFNNVEPQIIYIYLRKNITQFYLPDNISQPVIMIAAGSGIAPFISFIRQRKIDNLKKNTSTGDLWLIYGCRSPTSSLLFENELSDAVNSKVLKHLCLCFSRDTVNSPDEKYALKEISSILIEQACFPLKAQYVQDCILCKYSTDYEVSEHDIQLMNLVFEKGAKIMICGGPRALAFGVYESWLRLLAMRLYFERTQKWCKYSAIPEEDFINARAYVDIMRKAERFQEDVWA
ncbi:unnamed protein product [Schistosoma intercalatum]|nr:unnamed protein product [Schistosoma intercalatum]CAH8512130.1 unnamed protein product [Schistosoma intercalatum]